MPLNESQVLLYELEVNNTALGCGNFPDVDLMKVESGVLEMSPVF